MGAKYGNINLDTKGRGDFMNFIFASDSFKGSLSSEKIGKLLEKELKSIIPEAKAKSFLIADGGEGTLDAFMVKDGARRNFVTVFDPLFRKIKASYITFGNTAVISMSEASGLTLLQKSEQNPLYTTTYGTGELILDALKNGYRNIVVAIGGSATNDGGTGCMSALGVKFLDKDGKSVHGVGESLEKIAKIDTSCLVLSAREATFTVMCDVTNPLTGENGATYVYGPQKGATPEIASCLEKGMQNYARVIKRDLGIDANDIVGGGAAGGIGAALSCFLDAKMTSGIETLLDLVDFDSYLKNADFVISGEGRIDSQSASGKVLSGIGKRCLLHGVPLICIAGCLGDGYEDIYNVGVTKIYTLANDKTTLDEAINNAEGVYIERAKELFYDIKKGAN